MFSLFRSIPLPSYYTPSCILNVYQYHRTYYVSPRYTPGPLPGKACLLCTLSETPSVLEPYKHLFVLPITSVSSYTLPLRPSTCISPPILGITYPGRRGVFQNDKIISTTIFGKYPKLCSYFQIVLDRPTTQLLSVSSCSYFCLFGHDLTTSLSLLHTIT